MFPFEKCVFINCPYDNQYLPLLKTLLFSLKFNQLYPRIALERFDSGEVRLEKIKELIESSMYSIHDFSRVKSSGHGEYFRLNMPLELGLDIGCRQYHHEERFRKKRMLIMESETHSIQKALSDLAFADCKAHGAEEEELVYIVRNWLVENEVPNVHPYQHIWDEYNIFQANLLPWKAKEGYKKKDIERISIKEYLLFIDQWLKMN